MSAVVVFESKKAFHALFVVQILVLFAWHVLHGQVSISWDLLKPWMVSSAVTFFVGGIFVEPLYRKLRSYWLVGVLFGVMCMLGIWGSD